MAQTDSYRFIAIERREGVATLTVNRPDKLNALNAETVAEIDRAFRSLAQDGEVRGIVVTGAGEKAFVAGADIGELAQMQPIGGIRVSRQGQETFRFIERLHKPVVAAVNGYALGGGLELALACHMRIAAENARFGQPHARIFIELAR